MYTIHVTGSILVCLSVSLPVFQSVICLSVSLSVQNNLLEARMNSVISWTDTQTDRDCFIEPQTSLLDRVSTANN